MLKIPLKVTYAIFATLDLALRYGEGPVQARTIARRQTIPPRFIEQVLHALKQGGIVDSIRGPQGGYVLRQPPAEVSLATIVETMNGQAEPETREVGTNGQALRPPHREALLSTLWDRVYQAEREILSSVTLQSLIEQYTELEQKRAPMYHI